MYEGRDTAIIANGDTVCVALAAERGVHALVLDMHTMNGIMAENIVETGLSM